MTCKSIILLLVLFGLGCVSTQGNITGEFLILSEYVSNKIYIIDIETKTLTSLPIRDISSPSFVSYDLQEDTVYWGDRTGLHSIKIDGTNEKTVINTGYTMVYGIAIDPSERLIFYALIQDKNIFRLKIGSQEVTSVINITRNWAVELDIINKKIYWTTHHDFPYSIYCANYDGSQIKQLVSRLGDPAFALTIDINEKVMYWTQYPGRIERANLDGSNRQLVYGSTTFQIAIYGLDLYKGNTLFFITYGSTENSSVSSISTTGGPEATFVPYISRYINGLHVVERNAFCQTRSALPSTVTNVALNKTVALSSLYDSTSVGSNMVDGLRNSTHYTANRTNSQCAHTLVSTSDPWALVDLGQNYTIKFIYILNRSDCCASRLHDFDISIGDAITNLQNVIHYPAAMGSNCVFEVPSGTSGRYVLLQIMGPSEVLTVCEFEVYA